jgi:hypothetical protein
MDGLNRLKVEPAPKILCTEGYKNQVCEAKNTGMLNISNCHKQQK